MKMINKILNSNFNAKLVEVKILNPSLDPVVSVVMPVFNQERIILKHLYAISNNMFHPFEIIIVNDCSYDKSHAEIQKFIESDSHLNTKCVKISYFKTRWPWFETKCDDFSIRRAASDLIIEIQADMLIKEMHFDRKLKELLDSDAELAALSCRGTHGFDSLFLEIAKQKGADITDRIFQFKLVKKVKFKLKKIIAEFKGAGEHVRGSNLNQGVYQVGSKPEDNPMSKIFPGKNSGEINHQAGFIAELIDELPYEGFNEFSQETLRQSMNIWYGQTIMRGPLAISKKDYLAFGGFNTGAFYQGNDDHDLFLRMRHQGKKVGFTPINFASPTQLGNARQKRKIKSKLWSKFHRFARRQDFKKSELYRTATSNL
jgi:glycosyltransferase involved in cell wall biosynthesis